MKIVDVEAIPYQIPYRRPLKFASGEVHAAEHVLVRIHTDEGVVGVSDTPPRPYTYGETQGSVISVIQEIFRPQLLGMDPFAREQARSLLGRTVNNHTAKGSIDIALWDIVGQTLGEPVSRLLGGSTDRLRVSHMLGFKEPQALLEEALAMRERHGITTFKLKVGRRPVSLDIEALRALREGLPAETEIYLDANRGWSAIEAARVSAAVEDLDVDFFEEPNDASEHLGRRWLTRTSRIPVAADESVPDLGSAARELVTGGADMLCLKVARTGFTESSLLVGLAEGLGVDVYVGNQIDTQVGTAASLAFGAAFAATSRRAAELSNYLDMADDLLAEPLEIRDGVLLTRPAPGVGNAVDPDKLAHYRQDSPAITRPTAAGVSHPQPLERT